MKTNRLLNLVIMVVFTLSSVLTVTSCKKNIGSDNPDTPQVMDGTRQIVINAKQFNLQSINDYTLTISGPQNLTVHPSGQSYVLSDIVNGSYTISLSKSGYVGMTKVVQVDLPTDITVTWKYSVDLYLVKKSTPVAINNATGGTFTIPGLGLGTHGTCGNPTTVTIPAGALPGSGATDVSFTLIPVDPSAAFAQTVAGGTGSVSFYCEPEGLIFNLPVTFSIPLDIPSSVASAVPYHFAGKTGNVSTGNLNFNGDQITMNVTPDGSTANVQITKCAYWQVVGDYTITETTSFSNYLVTGTSQSGTALNGVYTATGTYGPVYCSLLDIPTSHVTISEAYYYPAVEFFRVSANARHTNKIYTIKVNSTGATIEQFTIPSSPVEFFFLIMSHDQGGS